MPDPREIKTFNTATFALMIEDIATTLGLKPSTVAGAAISIYVNALLDQADSESLTVVRRNLDRAIEMLQALRAAPHAEAMVEAARVISERQNAEVHQRDAE